MASPSTQRILELAHAEGFDLASLAPLTAPPRGEEYGRYLDQGRHADMGWMERGRERVQDPQQTLPAGRSILALGLGFSRPLAPQTPGGTVARYAAGRDYHNLVGKKLKRLTRKLREEGLVNEARWIVDAGPLLERSHAAQAGLGFESKATNLLHPLFGPWFFLAEILIDAEVEGPTSPPVDITCGTCTACLDACPTGALVAPGELDARLCISYQTIENRGTIPEELRPQLEGWLFGCDICSEVCPFGHDTPDLTERFGLHPALEHTGLETLVDLSEEEFAKVFEGSPLRRPGRAGLARNAALLLGNEPGGKGPDALLHALAADPSPVVREAAAWSLERAFGEDARVRAALDQVAR
ncbi:MAG: tRNA epoxyqueuosine(34) reductase QueG [Planctomycetaceae bacterium]|nr:tRNA epoxyqueuosine(34) reductase QueG [Planctomycetaceae bacterium]